MNGILKNVLFWLCLFVFGVQLSNSFAGVQLPGFNIDPETKEQVATFQRSPDIRIHINAPAVDKFDSTKLVKLTLYALPNGNTIEQTVGKVFQQGVDWHFNIQHIGAQTRFLRNQSNDCNLVIVYLETRQRSWPAWKARHVDHAQIIRETVEYLLSCFSGYQTGVILTGHSGGGRFIFSFMDVFTQIPTYVQRICFLDSDYGYEDVYGSKLVTWLNGDSSRFVSVIAYNDSVALYNGRAIVSATGGTWYRSKMMQRYFSKFYSFTSKQDNAFIRHTALNGRIKIILRKNPNREILHTLQVERNGFIHTMHTGTPLEGIGYTYYGERAYDNLIQSNVSPQPAVRIPLRPPHAPNGSAFIRQVEDLSFEQREQAILKEFERGNLPGFLRQLKTCQATFTDANQVAHQVRFQVFPDYLAIGSDDDYCRMPMGPITAQKIADLYGCTLPPAKLVNLIYQQAEIKLKPVPYFPVGNQNELVSKFAEHNAAIGQQFQKARSVTGQLVAGIKKDVVLSNLITDPNRPGHVVIYSWHKLNSEPIQPKTNIHRGSYVDYSHGIRLLSNTVLIDGKPVAIQTALQDSILFKLFSDEAGPLLQPFYNTE